MGCRSYVGEEEFDGEVGSICKRIVWKGEKTISAVSFFWMREVTGAGCAVGGGERLVGSWVEDLPYSGSDELAMSYKVRRT